MSEFNSGKFHTILSEVGAEVVRAGTLHAPMHSHHEGYAVLQEEVEEAWDEIKKKRSERDLVKLREEMIQVAAMAVRFIHDTL